MDDSIQALCIHDGSLIAAGSFRTAGGLPADRVAYWNGTDWHPLGAGVGFAVGALAAYDGELIAAGYENVAAWNGTSWRIIGSLAGYGFPGVSALTVQNGELVAGGNFTHAGGQLASNLARWNGSTWLSLAGGVDGNVAVFGDFRGDLIVGGLFTTAGTVVSPIFARWGPSLEVPSITQQPTNRKVVAGNAATFTLASSGGQPLSYQWRKDNANLTDDGHILGATTDSLTINAASGIDVGLYDCVVTNDCGAATTIAARLTVITNIPSGPLSPFEPANAIAD